MKTNYFLTGLFLAGIFLIGLLTACEALFLSMAGKDDKEEFYTVSFDHNNGTGKFVEIEVSSRDACLLPDKWPDEPQPEAQDNLFTGWYFEEGDKFNPRTTIASDVTIIAQWFPLPAAGHPVVVFDRNGGNTPASPSKMAPAVSGETLVRLPEEPTREGYIFTGWNTAANGSGTAFDLATTIAWPGEESVYAQWVPLNGRHVVSFHGNGANVEAHPRTMAIAPGQPLGTLPRNPEKANYEFTGWSTTVTNGDRFGGQTPVRASITVYAQWNQIGNAFTVAFNTMGGSFVPPQTVSSGGRAEDRVTSKEGYEFDGWFNDSALTNRYIFASAVFNNLTLIAKWDPISYQVMYDSNGGSGTTNPTIHVFGVYAPLAENDFTHDADTFIGWGTQAGQGGTIYAAGQNVINLSATQGDDVTLYAKWLNIPDNSFIVEFNTHAGSFVSPQLVIDGGTAARPPVPIKTGYVFDDWYTDDTFTTPYDFDDPVTDSITLHAQWNPIRYTISYQANFPSVSPHEPEHDYDTDITIAAADTFTHPGFNFVNWNTNSDGSGTAFYPGATVRNLTSIDGDVFPLFAQWVSATPDSFTVTFNSNEGTFVSPQTLTAGSTLTGWPITPTKTGFTFAGWWNGSGIPNWGTEWQAANQVNGNITLHARWTAITYTLQYANNGSAISSPPPQDYDFDDQITLYSGASLSNSGFTFAGWNTAQNGSGTPYQGGQSLRMRPPLINAAVETGGAHVITLHAQWTPEVSTGPVTVTFYRNHFASDPVIHARMSLVGTNTTLGVLPANPTPTDSSWIFGDWNTEANGSGTTFTAISTVSANMNVYARWTVDDPGSGSALEPFKVYSVATLLKVGTGADGWTLQAHYEQIRNIDMDGETFDPIGRGDADATAFTGSYTGQSGQAYTISNLTINGGAADYTGMFGQLRNVDSDRPGLLTNIRLVNPVISGGRYTGSLVGYNHEGTIEDSTVSMGNSSSVQGTTDVGGLVGYNEGTISGSSITMSGTATITGTGSSEGAMSNSYTGGLVGRNLLGTITGGSSTVTNVSVTAGAGDNNHRYTTGGLVGNNDRGTITNAAINITETISGYRNVGGLVGYAYGSSGDGTITNSNVSMASGARVEAAESEAGGLVGYVSFTSISGSSVEGGTVSGGGAVGGLVGYFTSSASYPIEDCFTNTVVQVRSGSIGSSFGGLVGQSSGTIRNSYAKGNVTGYSNVGGMVGTNSSPISNSFASRALSKGLTMSGALWVLTEATSTTPLPQAMLKPPVLPTVMPAAWWAYSELPAPQTLGMTIPQ